LLIKFNGGGAAAPANWDASQIEPGMPILGSMPSKPVELPHDVAKAFVKNMRAYFAEKNAIKGDQIADTSATYWTFARNPRRIVEVSQKTKKGSPKWSELSSD
jgi:hypothetical protein